MRSPSSSVRAYFAAALAALAGCNQLLGIDDVTENPSRDRDGDGVPDAVDNCPAIANPLQVDREPRDGVGDVCQCADNGRDDDGDRIDDGCDECVGPGPTGNDSNGDGIDDGCQPCPTALDRDVDGDGVDDGCDACLFGPPHDEDQDGVADACDNCAGIPNPDQLASEDPDPIGDRCDVDTYLETLGAFDPFTHAAPATWPDPAAGWTLGQDELVVAAGARPDFSSSLSLIGRTGVEPGAWIVVETVTTPVGGEAGIAIVESGGVGDTSTTCTIDAAGYLHVALASSSVVEVTSSMAVDPNNARLRYWHDHSGDFAVLHRHRCEAVDGTGKVVASAELASQQMPAMGRVGLTVRNGGATFRYFWLAQP